MLDPANSSVLDAGGALSPLAAFLWAAGGSLALEIISLYNEIRAEKTTGLPKYYRSPVFWIVRIFVTGIAGGLAVAEGASRPLLAVNIGASAPAILQLLSSAGSAPAAAKSPDDHKE
jgi:hypothetical protein